MPPMSWERSMRGLMARPIEKTPSILGTRISPVSRFTHVSANWAPKECMAKLSVSGFSSASTVTSAPGAGAVPCLSRKARAAVTIAVPHEVMPEEPPATDAAGRSVSPICSRIESVAQPRASAAIWVSEVQVPVPMSAAPIWTR
ncbi:hypothetical protein NONI108955_28410 [Nocardia ninae]